MYPTHNDRRESAPSSPIKTPQIRAPVMSLDPHPLPYWRARPTLASPQIDHYGEPVALVVAATLEQAQAAANLVRIAYAAEPGHYDFMAYAETGRTRQNN